VLSKPALGPIGMLVRGMEGVGVAETA